MVKVISTPGPKAIYIEKLKLAVLYKLDNHEIFPRLRGLFSSINYFSVPSSIKSKLICIISISISDLST